MTLHHFQTRAHTFKLIHKIHQTQIRVYLRAFCAVICFAVHLLRARFASRSRAMTNNKNTYYIHHRTACLLICAGLLLGSLSLCAASLRAQPDGAAFKFNESIDLLGATKVGRQPPIQASLLAAIVEFCFGQYVCAFRKFAGPMMCETSALSFVFFYLSRDSDNDNCVVMWQVRLLIEQCEFALAIDRRAMCQRRWC